MIEIDWNEPDESIFIVSLNNFSWNKSLYLITQNFVIRSSKKVRKMYDAHLRASELKMINIDFNSQGELHQLQNLSERCKDLLQEDRRGRVLQCAGDSPPIAGLLQELEN